jgi:NADH-quinone oxidoreductase subunit N
VLARAGFLLAIVGFAFKLSLVPFHMWVPDVYEGAPAPVTALLAAVSKGAVAATLWQWLTLSPLGSDGSVLLALTALAILSMLGGNLLCLWQENLKRLVAYSSVGHMGFWLVPLAVAGPLGGEAAGYYLAAYVAAVLAALGVIAFLSNDAPEERVQLTSYRGLFWHHPLAAIVLAVAFLSLAGIPLTVGFIAKFYVFAAGVEGARWSLVAVVAASSAIGIYYYLRVITALFVPGEGAEAVDDPAARAVLLFLLLFIVFYGVLPAPLMDAVRAAVAGG